MKPKAHLRSSENLSYGFQTTFIVPADRHTIKSAVPFIDSIQGDSYARHKISCIVVVPMNIAVMDAGGNLKAFTRMDDAFIGSIDIAQKKAKTARYFNMSTRDLGKASQPGGELYGIEVTNDGLVIFPGGVLLVDKNGVIVGSVGVSGGSVDEDESVAKAGAAVLSGR